MIAINRDGTFEWHVARCQGRWTLTRGNAHSQSRDPHLIRLSRIIPGELWCSEVGFLDFLDRQEHRALIRCFTQQSPKRIWSIDELNKHLGWEVPQSDIVTALNFCRIQGFVVEEGGLWQAGPQIRSVPNFGATFEWMVQRGLQTFHHAVARRNVHFKELQELKLGDLDVLAFTRDERVMTVECKSSTAKTVLNFDHLRRFVKRARTFPSDIALLLIDTESERHVVKQIRKINRYLGRDEQCVVSQRSLAGSIIFHVVGNIYIANTAGEVLPILGEALRMGMMTETEQIYQAEFVTSGV